MEENREKTSVYIEKVLKKISFIILFAGLLSLSPGISAVGSVFEQNYTLNLFL